MIDFLYGFDFITDIQRVCKVFVPNETFSYQVTLLYTLWGGVSVPVRSIQFSDMAGHRDPALQWLVRS